MRKLFRLVLGLGLGGIVSALGAESPAPASVEREMLLDHRYLNIPVKAGVPHRTISVIVDGRVVRAFEVELAEGAPDYWAFTDVTPWKGQRATLRLDPFCKISKPEAQQLALNRPLAPHALDALRVDDDLVDAASLYHEPRRPQFHFTTRRGWLNDPNGLLYYAGEYHMFYQYQPFSMASLNSDKSWGHAVSRDLLHWEELGVAIYPDEHGGAWSGSAMVDTNNVAGLQTGTEPAMLLFYTATGRSAMNPKPAEPADFVQNLAYSNDRGRSWTMYAGNPVLKNVTPLNRDPLVYWHEPSKHWLMVLYAGIPASNPGNQYFARIFTSENLKDWTYQSKNAGYFDCPMFFELPLDGNASDTRWIMHCADMKYKVGRFDGKTFTPETDPIDGQRGKTGEAAYAAQIIRNTPPGRTLEIAWIYDEHPGARQIMSFPCEVSLVTTPSGPRLRWVPAREIENLHVAPQTWHNLPIDSSVPVVRAHGRHLDLKADIQLGDAREIELNVAGLPIVVHTMSKVLTCRGYALPVALKDKRLQLRVLLDETSLELYADDGLVYLPICIPALGENDAVTLSARGGAALAETLKIAEVKSIWPSAPAPEKIR